jgi:hypothetical protein
MSATVSPTEIAQLGGLGGVLPPNKTDAEERPDQHFWSGLVHVVLIASTLPSVLWLRPRCWMRRFFVSVVS